jgi:FkbM family methyltransferase
LKSRIEPLVLRRGSSDFSVFRQVILEDQYGLEEVGQPQYIVDAGANIGLSSVVFLERFPQCRLLAIEPDPQNYAIARKNLDSYGDRCRLWPVALWSEAGSLTVQRGVFRDGLDWSCQTIVTSEHTGAVVAARTMKSLLDEAGFPRIDFLKVDIEGAELQVFGEGDRSFLMQTRCCATECHGPQCREVYIKAIESYGFAWRQAGELTIGWRSQGAELESPEALLASKKLPNSPSLVGSKT